MTRNPTAAIPPAAALPPLTWPQKTVAALAGLLFAGMAALGGWGSFDSVRKLAEPWFGNEAWIVPIGVDLGILALVTVALLLEWLAMPLPMLRWNALTFTGATVWLNISAAHGDPAGIIGLVERGDLVLEGGEEARCCAGRCCRWCRLA